MTEESKEMKFCQIIRLTSAYLNVQVTEYSYDALNLKTAGWNYLPMYVKKN